MNTDTGRQIAMAEAVQVGTVQMGTGSQRLGVENVVAERPAVHWSIYLVFAATCLLISGLASDPRVADVMQSLFAMR